MSSEQKPTCRYEDIIDLIKESKTTIEKAVKSNVRIDNGKIITYIDHRGRQNEINPKCIDIAIN